MKKITDPKILAMLNEAPPAATFEQGAEQQPTESLLAPQTDVPVLPIASQASPAPAQAPSRVTDPSILSELEEETHTVEGWLDDPVNAARAVLDGIWFGWSDEVGASIAAGAVKLIGGPGSEKSFSEIRREMIGQLEQERADYSTEHPAASLLLNLGGAVLSPANYILPGAASLTTTRAAASTIPAVARTGATLEALGASKAILPTLARGAGLGITEGAVAGAGAAQEGQKGEGALSGAVFGAAIPAGIAGIRGGAATVAKRRITQSLGEGADFIPLTLAGAEEQSRYGSFMASFYKSVVGKSFGGASLISQQTKRWTDPVKKAIETTTENINQLKQDAKNTLKIVKARLKSDAEALSDEIAALKEGRKRSVSDIETRNNRTAAAQAVNKAKTMELDSYVNALEAAFRAKAVKNSIPEGVSKEAIEEIQKAPTQLANRLLDLAWKEHGFSMLKNRNFRINPERIAARMEQELGGEWALAAQLVGSKATRASEFIASYLETYTRKGGYISGEDLSRLRSRIGTLANDMSGSSGASGAEQQVLKQLQEILNDTVEAQLGKNQLKMFKQHREAWKYFSILKDATLDASRTAGQRGAFTSQQWLTASLRNRQALGRRGEVVLQEEADEIADLVSSRDRFLQERADLEIQTRMNRAAAEIDAVAQETETKIKVLEAQKKTIERTKPESSPEYLAINNQLDAAKKELTALEAQKKTLKDLTPSPNPSIFEKIAATSFLGSGLALAFGPTAIPAGIVVSRILASEGGQRFLAGQTAAQEAIMRGVEATRGAETALATRAGMRTAAQQTTEPSSSLSSGDIQAMGKGSLQAKAQAYYRLDKAGKLEEVKRKNPKVYRELKEAYEKVMSQ